MRGLLRNRCCDVHAIYHNFNQYDSILQCIKTSICLAHSLSQTQQPYTKIIVMISEFNIRSLQDDIVTHLSYQTVERGHVWQTTRHRYWQCCPPRRTLCQVSSSLELCFRECRSSTRPPKHSSFLQSSPALNIRQCGNFRKKGNRCNFNTVCSNLLKGEFKAKNNIA